MTLFSFVFVERCFSCLVWVHRTLHVGGSFCREHTFFWSRYVFLLDPAKTLVSLVLLLSGRQRWTPAEHVALNISVFLLSPFYSALSVSVFGTIQRRLACPCASVDTHQSTSVVKFHVAQFQRCDASFSLFPLKGGYLCILVASYGHVSLITDQLDWQRCRSPLLHCCRVVVGSLVSCDS